MARDEGTDQRDAGALARRRPAADPEVQRVAGHFGELLQGRIGAEGPVALISLPCPALSLRAHLGGGTEFELGGEKILTLGQAQAFLRSLELSLHGRVEFHTDMPVGGGAGASTAALVALARLAGYQGEPQALADACITSEGASDPLMFPHPERLLWASRDGQIQAQLPPLPRFEVIGGFFGPMQRTDAGDNNFPDISDLLPAWTKAAEAGDLPTLAQLSSRSAQRTLVLRGAPTDPPQALAQELGALGHVIAHTGAARGLIFAPDTVPAHAESALRDAGFRQILRFQAGGA
ncbi:propanediol utilization protein [Pararhodobacter oceanensis]|uniref:propanediol utilization protein n=1 Tax=Pararhodobacter oceanensis TaxID=2172121 RepID=UPI003A8EDE76